MFSVVIPTRNPENSVPCVSAIRRMDNESLIDIIVVDDFQTKAHLDDFRHGLQDVSGQGSVGKVCSIIAGIRPFTFSRNVNLGIRAAGDSDLIILNDDALLQTPGGFTLLSKACQDHPEYGLIASSTNVVGNPNQQHKALGLRDEPRMVCFICVYIPRRTINLLRDTDRFGEQGLLDERYCLDMGLEDDDYCLRVRKAGLKIGIHDGCYVDHSSLKSEYRSKGDCPFTQNLGLFIQKWGVDNWNRDREHSEFAHLWGAK